MAAKKPPITETVLKILREAPGPLSVDEVAERLEALLPGVSKSPKGSVRNTLSNNRNGAIGRLPDGRIGLKARLINGASLRHIFYDEDMDERRLLVGDALFDLLAPLTEQVAHGGALRLELQGGQQLLGRVDGSLAERALDAGPAFWDWLEGRGATSGDSLIVTALDAEERRYSLRHEPAAARDEAAIALRNAELLSAAVAYLRRQRGRAVIWDLVAHLNVSGIFHHPTPPDPFEDLWTEAVYRPVQLEYGVTFPLTGGRFNLIAGLAQTLGLAGTPDAGAGRLPSQVEIGPADLPPGVSFEEVSARIKAIYTQGGLNPIAADDPLLPVIAPIAARSGLPAPTGGRYQASDLLALFGSDDATLDWIDDGVALGMVDHDDAFAAGVAQPRGAGELPAAYAPTGGPRKPQPSRQGRRGLVKTYVLRLAMAHHKGFSRDIEIAQDQTCEDLHLAIQKALGWDDDHLYSFFMGKRPYDQANEIGSPWSESARHTHQVELGSLGLRAKQKFFYLFDYGDSHLFTLQVVKINPQAPRGSYPRVVAREGRAPSQYFDEDA